MITINIDGKEYKVVNESSNLLEACLTLGIDIPYFCWHPALGSVGICRQCAVKQYQNNKNNLGQIVMSCMTPVKNGLWISIKDHEAREFRRSVIEWLMINHPHDCPVCEEGGSCHLQDMTMMSGHISRRYRFSKRTHFNQYLGPFISHDMNRCISCYRCVRYYKDYADGNDFGVYGARDNIYFGRYQEGELDSEFSGNLVEICPTGALIDKTFSKRYSRKWDMQFSPSICHQCSIGCNIILEERYGKLRRIENRYNGCINGYFLCDRGRFGYDYVNLKDRPRHPMIRRGNRWVMLNANEAVQEASKILRHAHKLIGIGSARASMESNFALLKLVGMNNFYIGVSHSEKEELLLMLSILQNSGIHTPSLCEIENYDAILILGEDVTQTGARIALAIRQAIKGKVREIAAQQKIANWHAAAIINVGQNSRYPLFITSVDKTRLDDIAAWNYYASVSDQARLSFAIAHSLDKTAPTVNDLDTALQSKIDLIAKTLANAKKPLIISGSGAGSKELIAGATNIALALKKQGKNVGISFILSEANSMGITMIGGKSIDEALDMLEQGAADSLIVLENDLYRHASETRVNAALDKISYFIVLDHLHSSLQEKANLILSAANFTESSGTLINQEGRAQRFFQVYDPAYYDDQSIILASWRWLYSIHSMHTYKKTNWTKLDHVIDHLIEALPHLADIKKAAPDASFRIQGQKIARGPNRYSGRTSMNANINIHEPRVPYDHDTMFTFSMEGSIAFQAPNQQITFAWTPGWNSSQAWNKFQDTVGGHLKYGDPGVRLLELKTSNLDYFSNVPIALLPSKDNEWYVAPYWHLFGSEETSQRSSAIQNKMPKLYIVISQSDAKKLNIDNNTALFSFNCMGINMCLPARVSRYLSTGQIGLPLGLPGIPPILSGHYIKNLQKVKTQVI